MSKEYSDISKGTKIYVKDTCKILNYKEVNE